MKAEINAWLEDINIAIKQIYDFLPADIDYFDFEKDIKTQKAIERNLRSSVRLSTESLKSILILQFQIHGK